MERLRRPQNPARYSLGRRLALTIATMPNTVRTEAGWKQIFSLPHSSDSLRVSFPEDTLYQEKKNTCQRLTEGRRNGPEAFKVSFLGFIHVAPWGGNLLQVLGHHLYLHSLPNTKYRARVSDSSYCSFLDGRQF